MATAIDFAALMAEEKRKMLHGTGNARASSPLPPRTSPAGDNAAAEGLAWQVRPDREVALLNRAPLELGQFRTAGELGDVFYIPGFLAEAEARDLLARIDEMPEASWTDLRRRHLQNHGGIPHPDGMQEEPVPAFVQQVFRALVEAGVFPPDQPPNHVLINSYRSGQGIAPHQDGPLYKASTYAVCTAVAFLRFQVSCVSVHRHKAPNVLRLRLRVWCVIKDSDIHRHARTAACGDNIAGRTSAVAVLATAPCR